MKAGRYVKAREGKNCAKRFHVQERARGDFFWPSSNGFGMSLSFSPFPWALQEANRILGVFALNRCCMHGKSAKLQYSLIMGSHFVVHPWLSTYTLYTVLHYFSILILNFYQ